MMVYTTMSVSNQATTPKAESAITGKRPNMLNRSISGQNLRQHARIQRAYSDNNLCYSTNRVQATMNQSKLKNSRSMGIFDFNLSSSVILNPIKKCLFDSETTYDANVVTDTETDTEERDEQTDVSDVEIEKEKKKRANWIERLMEIRSRWVQKQSNEIDGENEEEKLCDEDGHGEGCEVDYSDDEDVITINQETFSEMLNNVSWSDTKQFSQLAFLCNMAYVIPEIEVCNMFNSIA